MTNRFHLNVKQENYCQPIPWNVEEEKALFSEESFQLLWEMELGLSMSNARYSEFQNSSLNIKQKLYKQKNQHKNEFLKMKNTSLRYSVLTSLNQESYSNLQDPITYNEGYVDFSSAATHINKSKPESIQYDQIIGERLDAIIGHGGARCKNDEVSLKEVVNNDSLMKNHKQVKFVNKLMLLLDNDPDSSIISWLSHGRSFLVHDKDRFVKEIMPLYFTSTRYKSFQRQLNMWGFQRICGPVDTGAYYHQLFLRGIPALSFLIQRKKTILSRKCGNNNGGKRTGRPTANPELEPDFHSLSKLRPLPTL